MWVGEIYLHGSDRRGWCGLVGVYALHFIVARTEKRRVEERDDHKREDRRKAQAQMITTARLLKNAIVLIDETDSQIANRKGG